MHSGHKRHCPVNPQRPQALPDAFTEHSPLSAHPHGQKSWYQNFNAQGANISIRSLYPIALISIFLQLTHKSRFVLFPGEKLLITESLFQCFSG